MNTQHNTLLLTESAERGDAAEVQRLIPLSDPKKNVNGSCALLEAANNGHSECVRLLIPVSEPKASDSLALCRAALNGHTECVQLLIPVSDPKADYSCALRWAIEENHVECVDLLLDVSDADNLLQRLQELFPDQPKRWQYLEGKIAQRQREILNNEIVQHSGACTYKKISKI